MEIQVDLVDQDHRMADALADELIEHGKYGLFPGGHLNEIVGSVSIAQHEVIVRWRRHAVSINRLWVTEGSPGEDPLIVVFQFEEKIDLTRLHTLEPL
jgi:hypothetical protein